MIKFRRRVVALITSVILATSPGLNIDICLTSKCHDGWYGEAINNKRK